MGRDLCDRYPEVRTRFFERADDILGFPISHLCFEGPEADLVRTENQQPAIFLVSVATLFVLTGAGIRPHAVAGHSLGEYSALVAAGCLQFEEGLRLTRRRGKLMAEIGALTGGIMAAILGLGASDVEDICTEASSVGVVEVANYNSPMQTVISGEEAAVSSAMDAALARGARRAIRLDVSAPFHSSLMAPLRGAFAPELEAVTIRNPEISVVANVTGTYEKTASEVKLNLIAQLASAVRWTANVECLVADGVKTVIEVGPGKVLTGLMRSIAPEVQTHRTDDMTSLESVLTALA